MEWRNWGRTNGPVGLACGTQSGFNCLLAWTDSGAPNSEILYTYFRVLPGPPNDIQWWQFWGDYGVWELPFYADANTGVTAAFFNDAYHLAWKRASFASQVRYTYRDSGGYGGWTGSGSTSYDTYGASGIVGTPTFMAKDGKESALVWTTH